MTPSISVIVPCFNASRHLPLLLESLRDQLAAPKYEVVAVDNASTDTTSQVLLSWQQSFPELRVVVAAEEQGASYARNVGVREARSSLLLFCDADDVVSRYWISHGKRNFEVSDFWSGSAIPIMDVDYVEDVSTLREMISDSKKWEPLRDQEQSFFPILMGGNFGITREYFEKLGGFDQSLGSAGEDNELAVRAALLGYSLPIAESSRIAYRIRTNSKEQRRLQYRAAKAHALIATRYKLWPHSNEPHWLSTLIRCGISGIRMLFSPKKRDWSGLSERTAAALGLLVGNVRYRMFGLTPKPRYGVGLKG